MYKRIILISLLLLSFAIISCKQANKPAKSHDITANNSDKKDSAGIQTTMNTAAQIYAKPEVPILCYHRIADGKKGDYTVSTATFKAHIKILSDSGFHSISPSQLYDYLVYNKPLPEKPVMITFDDSREEHSSIAAPVLERYNFRGVFFIMTITYNKKKYMTTEQIAMLSKAGHTIGLHSWDHTMATKYKEAADWQKQVIEPKKKLEGIVGKSVEYWAYPNGVSNQKSAEELSKYCKLSFTLISKRDSILPLQSVRRMIAAEWTAPGLLKSMKRTFGLKK